MATVGKVNMEGAVQPAGAPAPTEGAPQDPGQGAPETPGLYQDVLEGVPSEYHESLIERLKDMDGKATQKFQSHAERVKPYEEAGILDADPESLTGWMNLSGAIESALGDPTRGIAPDPEAQQAVSQWWEQLGDQLGLFEEEGGEGTGQEAQDLLDLTPQKLEELIGSQIGKATQPLLQRMEQQEQEKIQAEAQQQVKSDLAALREKHPNLTDEDEKYIMAFAWQFGQEAQDPIQTGFEEFQRVVSRGENNLFEQKVNQPSPVEAGGRPNTQAPAVTSENAKELALERLHQMQAT